MSNADIAASGQRTVVLTGAAVFVREELVVDTDNYLDLWGHGLH